MHALTHLAGRRVIASISGGKDSAAMSLHLRELGIEHDRVFMDTGWEHPKTYEYLRGELARVLGPIEEIRNDLLFPDLVRKKGMFPSRQRRWCTDELKMRPFRHWRENIDGEIVNAVGIRKAESERRARMVEWEWSDGLDALVWRPILEWSEADVIAIHKRHGLAPNPLYLAGARRVGCWPCIMSRKTEIRLVADTTPERIDEIRALEADAARVAAARLTDGEVRHHPPPTMFQAPLRGPNGEAPCVPIDEVVEWSRTARGGRQFELFAPSPSDEGCMRWGMCDTAAAEASADNGAKEGSGAMR